MLNNFFTPGSVVYIFLFFCVLGISILLYKYSKNIFMFFLGLVFIVVCNYAFHAQFVWFLDKQHCYSNPTICVNIFEKYKDSYCDIFSLLFYSCFIFLITALLILYEMLVDFQLI